MKVLITGGFGYIGAHLVKLLAEQGGHEMHIIDRDANSPNLDFVKKRAQRVDILNLQDADWVGGWRYDAVIHLAADISVEESAKDPLKYWDNNVTALTALLKKAPTDHLLYASTGTAAQPANAYAYSKLAGEQVVRNFADSHPDRVAAASVFRFYNVSGLAEGIKPTGQPTHLIRIAAEVAAGKRSHLTIYGTDYDTDDGTAVRDYVHVNDIAAALAQVAKDGPIWDKDVLGIGFPPRMSTRPIELGTAKGASVMEVVRTMQQVSERPVPIVFGARRPGDVARLVCARPANNFTCNYDLMMMCRDAFMNQA